MAYEKNVFVNCPFDSAFYPLLRPLLFTILYLGFTPRIALERLDSGEPRFLKIIELISESKFAVHDLSRMKAEKAGEFFRLNMPFELGIDVGCRLFKKGKWSDKKCLILEKERYRYQAAISDLSNSDIAAHGGEPAEVVRAVRNWLNGETKLGADGPAKIWGRFNDFMAENYAALRAVGYSDEDVQQLPINELMTCITDWLHART